MTAAGGHRVLLVEDDAAIADFVARGLREEGFAVERAVDGNTGWMLLAAGGYDLAVLDWTLPGADGVTLVRRLRAAGQATPALMLTARDAVPDRVEGLDAGADDYLSKPFAFDELLARVRALVRRPVAVVAAYGVRIDLASQRVDRAGRHLDLTAKEYSLLLFLARHPGEVLTRGRLYEAVWDERYDGLSNTLEVHVMELRRKLEAHGPRIIHTLRGRGYRFAADPS